MNDSINIAPFLQPILSTLGLIIAGLIASYIPKAIAAFETYTSLKIDDHARAALVQAVQAAAGTVETRIDQKLMSVAQVHVANPAVRALAQEAIDNASAVSASVGVTSEAVARMIVGATDTLSRIPTGEIK